MAAFNKIGSGSASSLEVAKTKGGKPIAPPSARFLKINSTSVHLILSAWQDSDCPILYFVVESRRDGPTNENEWRLVSNNILPQQRFPLVDLMPGTRYFLRVAGHNHAGSTLAEYDFTTLSPNTGRQQAYFKDANQRMCGDGLGHWQVSLCMQLVRKAWQGLRKQRWPTYTLCTAKPTPVQGQPRCCTGCDFG
uniref:Fibronectin type-III domain-containing protein n=1 Tax=Timema douglasi TaxID=61478 RepID=A0A7R8ZAB8_TIMDO|nr:unnamed protein product [Timema douglasi]